MGLALGDFQVEAMIGYRDRGTYSNGVMPYVFEGETSSWSNTQTLTIPEASTSTSPSSTSIVPELGGFAILAILLVSSTTLIARKKIFTSSLMFDETNADTDRSMTIQENTRWDEES